MSASALLAQATLVSLVVPTLFAFAAILLLVGLALSIMRYRERPGGKTSVVIVILAFGLAALGGVWAHTAYRSYELRATWSFGYELSIKGNGTAPESLVVPIVEDEGLLTGLHLSSGSANWSYVDTAKGRGLFVRFAGSATIETTVSAFPRPAVFPDTAPTMTVSANCIAQPSNCTGPPSVWIFYSGPAGAHISLSLGSFYLWGDLAVGWAGYETWPPAMPAA